jgi:hypothetical protein
MDQVGHGHREDFIDGVPEDQFHGGIGIRMPAVDVSLPDPVAGRVKDSTVLLLAFAQRFLSLPALGDEARLLHVLVGAVRKLAGQCVQRLRHALKLLVRHGRHFTKGRRRHILV